MTVVNPRFDSLKKKKPIDNNKNFRQGGQAATSTVKWTYNFDLLEKWITILFGAVALAGSVWMIRQDVIEKQAKETAKIEVEQERRKYLERRLEKIKQETIAAELAKSEANKPSNQSRHIATRTIQPPPSIYTWTNEKGQTVYSNKSKEK